MGSLKELLKVHCQKPAIDGDATSLYKVTQTESRAEIAHSLRLQIRYLCLEELNKSQKYLSVDKYRRMEKTLLRIADRIAEPLLVQIREVKDSPTHRAHNLQMITDAFKLHEVGDRSDD
jgi:hypothetical protein